MKDAIPYVFTMGSHTAAWRHFKIRPQGSVPKPELTASEFCVHDRAHNDYLYTKAWVDKLCRELADVAKFQEITGALPRPK